MTISNYRDLLVWQEAMRLAHLAYDCSNLFPSFERFVLVPQLRRAALSVPGNIAEGQGRTYTGEFLNFLSNARGSLQELETYLIFAQQRQYLSEAQFAAPMQVSDRVSRMLNRLRHTLRTEQPRAARR